MSIGNLGAYLRITPDYVSNTSDAAFKPGTQIVIFGSSFKKMIDLSVTSSSPLLLDINTIVERNTYYFIHDGSSFIVIEQGK